MKIVIAGGHGQIALFLERFLVNAGHEVHGIIRKPEQAAALESIGAVADVLDLEDASEHDVAQLLADADVAVFAAGAGPGSGLERKESVDFQASVLLANAAELVGVPRLIQISALSTDAVRDGQRPPNIDDVFYFYLQAKLAAEDDLLRRELGWTIVRPGRLVDTQGTGLVALSEPYVGTGEVPREDVAAVISELIETGRGTNKILELVSGSDSITDAVAKL